MSASGDLFPAELRVALAMGNYHFQFCRFLGTLVLDPGVVSEGSHSYFRQNSLCGAVHTQPCVY